MDKGIIIGAEVETATRPNLRFVMFRYATNVSAFTVDEDCVQGTFPLSVSSFLAPHSPIPAQFRSSQRGGILRFAL